MKDPIPFGPYLLLERVDIGGMAEVFRARAPDGKVCAVKRLLPGVSEDPDLARMFLEEARLTAQLDHPGIVAVRDAGRIGERYFMAMDYVAGAHLAAVLRLQRRGTPRISVALASWVCRQVALALEHAHSRCDGEGRHLGIVHRDVSPQNVLLAFSGAVKLIDFGIARTGDRPGEDGLLRGKVSYMSPEHACGRPVGPGSDVFALGAVLHEMLAGTKLFRGDSDLVVLDRIRNAAVEPPSARNPNVPEALDRVVLRALARDPADRFPSAASLADALAPWTDPESPRALARLLQESFPEEWERERRRSAVEG